MSSVAAIYIFTHPGMERCHDRRLSPHPRAPGHADLFTMDVCPRNTCRHCPVSTSHFRMVQSALHVKAASFSSWQKVT